MAGMNVSAAIRRARRAGSKPRASVVPSRKLRRAADQLEANVEHEAVIDTLCDGLEPGDAIEFMKHLAGNRHIEVFDSLEAAAQKNSMRICALSPVQIWSYANADVVAGSVGIFVEWRRVIEKSHHMRFSTIQWSKIPIVFVNGREFVLEAITSIKKIS